MFSEINVSPITIAMTSSSPPQILPPDLIHGVPKKTCPLQSSKFNFIPSISSSQSSSSPSAAYIPKSRTNGNNNPTSSEYDLESKAFFLGLGGNISNILLLQHLKSTHLFSRAAVAVTQAALVAPGRWIPRGRRTIPCHLVDWMSKLRRPNVWWFLIQCEVCVRAPAEGSP